MHAITAEYPNDEIIEYLIQKGADVNANVNGMTPLNLTLSKILTFVEQEGYIVGNQSLLEILINNGADINQSFDRLNFLNSSRGISICVPVCQMMHRSTLNTSKRNEKIINFLQDFLFLLRSNCQGLLSQWEIDTIFDNRIEVELIKDYSKELGRFLKIKDSVNANVNDMVTFFIDTTIQNYQQNSVYSIPFHRYLGLYEEENGEDLFVRSLLMYNQNDHSMQVGEPLQKQTFLSSILACLGMYRNSDSFVCNMLDRVENEDVRSCVAQRILQSLIFTENSEFRDQLHAMWKNVGLTYGNDHWLIEKIEGHINNLSKSQKHLFDLFLDRTNLVDRYLTVEDKANLAKALQHSLFQPSSSNDSVVTDKSIQKGKS